METLVTSSTIRATILFVALGALPLTRATAQQARPSTDPLPSWNEGAAKRAILTFVARVTTPSSPDFVAPGDRIATFDNDGTLWQEKPLAELAFTLAKLRKMASSDSSLRQVEPYRAALESDTAYLKDAGDRAVLDLLTKTHSGMTEEQFALEVRSFLAAARHPSLGRPYTELVYQPMLELLRYLRANGFTTWICSGGTTAFMRVFSSDVYGIPAQQVIGSDLKREPRTVHDRMVIWRLPGIETIDDKDGKPLNIDRQIGQRPLLAAGNVRSGGDVAHLEFSHSRMGPSLQLLVDHDDADREFAYQEPNGESLAAAVRFGFTIVSMKRDWKIIFPASPSTAR
jgi:phosphoglycolate phosphatase-like HAD superfamily hydrolase